MRLARTAQLATAGSTRIAAPAIKYNVLNEIKLTAASQVTKITVSGGSNTGAANTDTTADLAPGQTSHVRFTGLGTSGTGWSLTPATPWDMTSSYLRFLIRVSLYTSTKNISVRLATNLAGYTAGNYYSYAAKAKSTDSTAGNWFLTNTWVHDSIAPQNMTVNGSAPALNSIGYIVFVLSETATNATTIDLASVQQIAKVGTKAKVVICHDDSVESGAEAIYTRAHAYGFPVYEATEWEGLNGTTFLTNAEITKYLADSWQFGSHATTSTEHVSVTASSVTDQARRNKQAVTKRGMSAANAADFSYWGGLNGATAFPQVQSAYRSGRWNTSNLQWPETQPPAEPWLMKALLATTSDTFTGLWQPFLTAAAASNGLAIFVFHQDVGSNSTFATEFDSLLAYLDANRATFDVVTIATALSASTA